MQNPSSECPRFEICSAPLCPLEEKELQTKIWFPDDEICKKQPAPKWVATQRKIAKKAKDKNKYFTFGMLNRNCRISKGILGLDPEKDEVSQLAKWLKMHPEKRELTILEKKIIAKRFKKAREEKKNKK